jgi:SAM-dependent methyltransferase
VTDYDARLVALYDEDNPDGPDHGFYRSLADEMGAQTVVDIGCGTGILTVTFARPGRRVVGIDPSPNMLAWAESRPDGANVRWVAGDSRDIPGRRFDYAVMTGNVAQHIPDGEWERTLSDIHSALRVGGVLAFESRNPKLRAWDTWAEANPTTRPTEQGPLREWLEVSEPAPGRVTLTAHNEFENIGDDVVEELTLAFRERAVLESQLTNAGFTVETVWGSWDRLPCTDESPVMIFQARRK